MRRAREGMEMRRMERALLGEEEEVIEVSGRRASCKW